MKEIRYWTSHPEGRENPAWMDVFETDADRFRFVYDAVDPDCVVASEHIYTRDRERAEFARLWSPDRLLVFYAGECAFPDMNIFDYAVAFDRRLALPGRIVRRPTLSFYRRSVFSSPYEGCADPAGELGRKSGFCNFLYANPEAHPRRDALFRLLSTYRRVDSLGPHLNNCGNRTSRNDADWRKASVDLKSGYKFSIACENAVYPGYVSEKIISSFQAHTIPVYFGDPTVAEDFNPKAFVNANDMTDEEVLAEVRRIDADDRLWMEMVSEPSVTAGQRRRMDEEDARYRAFWNDVFSQDVMAAKRAPRGTWTDLYLRNWRTLTHGLEVEMAERSRHGMDKVWYKVYRHAKKHLMGKDLP